MGGTVVVYVLLAKSHVFLWRCPYIAIGEAEESDPDDEELYEKNAEKGDMDKSINHDQGILSTRKNPYQWDGNSQFADVNGETIHARDYVFLFEEVSSSPMQIAQVIYFFKRNFCDRVHCRKLWWVSAFIADDIIFDS